MRDFLGCTSSCATCQWWEGERVADREQGWVRTPRHAGMGFCRSRESWWVGRVKQAESRCCFWKQWVLVGNAGHGPPRSRLIMLGCDMRDIDPLAPPDVS